MFSTTLIVAALIRQGDAILLVQQQGPGDAEPAWALPGGRVEPGELLTSALAREVREETGITILDPGGLLYVLQHAMPPQSAQSLVYVFEVAAWSGAVLASDPDRFILSASFVPHAEALQRIETRQPWAAMREPLLAHLRGEAARGTLWVYQEDSLVGRV